MLENISAGSLIFSAFIGIGLAAASGFRVFMPMFALSLASFLGWVHLPENFSWLSGLPALITTGIAMVVEILAYYIPFVDHLLDTLTVPLATVAGTILFASQFAHLDPFPHWALALIAGGGTAAAISTGFAGTRAASTATTGGLGNHVIATAETAGGGLMSLLAFTAPIIAALLALALVIGAVIFGRKIFKKFQKNSQVTNV